MSITPARGFSCAGQASTTARQNVNKSKNLFRMDRTLEMEMFILSRRMRKDLAQSIARSSKVCKLHLGILPREDDAVCACAECGLQSALHVLGRGAFFGRARSRQRRHIDVDARIDHHLTRDAFHCALRLPRNIVSRKAGRG